MEVLRADSAGACYGVNRALRLAAQTVASGKTAQTLGPLIHNPRVVADLAEKSIGVADDVDEISAEAVIIRSHGITPQVARKVKALPVTMVDATCPHVLKAQQAAKMYAEDGKVVLVVGEEHHPEVEGLCAWARDAGGTVHVVQRPADIPHDLCGPVGIVVQTTQPAETLDGIVSKLEARAIDFEVSNTICNATSLRQNAARDLARQVDAMVVVGGHNSSNTKRLVEICQQEAPMAFHVEDASELSKKAFSGCTIVGVTAGASTPEEHIVAIEDCLRAW